MLVSVIAIVLAATGRPGEFEVHNGIRADRETTVTWSATGGSIAPSGLYTAGGMPGTFRVIASNGRLADTATVTITATMSRLEKVVFWYAVCRAGAAVLGKDCKLSLPQWRDQLRWRYRTQIGFRFDPSGMVGLAALPVLILLLGSSLWLSKPSLLGLHLTGQAV